MLTYPWLDGLGIDGPYLIGDVPASVAGTELDGFVFVQAECRDSESLLEVRWVLEQARRNGTRSLRGVVARVDLTDPNAQAEIERIAEIEAIVGVRHNIQGQPRGFAQTLHEGIEEVARRGLVFDLCCLADELDDVLALVESVGSGALLVLDHLAKPEVGATGFAGWADRIGDLASAPNVVCKLSGLMTQLQVDGSGRVKDFAPYLAHALDVFGLDRVLYGSDWPVCTLRGSMDAWAQVVATALGDDEDAHRRVFFDNAVRVYRLDATERRDQPR